jgi:predicted secreted protein
MKASVGTLTVIAALSLVVWTAVYILNPSTLLTQAETVIVVAACAALVFGLKWIVSNFSKVRGDDEPHA